MSIKKYEAVRKLLEVQGDPPETIEATVRLIEIQDRSEKWNALRSWIGVLTGVAALAVSIFVALT